MPTSIHPSRSPHRGAGLAAAVVLAALTPLAATATAAPPTVTVVPNTTSVLPAGKACPFRVVDRTLPDSRRIERVYRNGRHVITGPARERLRNPANGRSLVADSSARITFRKGEDGNTRYRFSGPMVFYFYPGDRGPEGVVGDDGALYHVVGRVGETLAKDGTVTAFALRGRFTELCSRLA